MRGKYGFTCLYARYPDIVLTLITTCLLCPYGYKSASHTRHELEQVTSTIGGQEGLSPGQLYGHTRTYKSRTSLSQTAARIHNTTYAHREFVPQSFTERSFQDVALSCLIPPEKWLRMEVTGPCQRQAYPFRASRIRKGIKSGM